MVIITRSKRDKHEDEKESDDETIEHHKKRRSKPSVIVKIHPRSFPSSCKASSSVVERSENSSSGNISEEEDDDEEEDLDEEFELPDSILNNPKLKKKADKIITYITDSAPTLETILTTKLRKEHRAELFETYMIYDSIMPQTEERTVMRKHLSRLLKQYETEFHDYKQHKKELKYFETITNHKNDLADIQYSILRLNATTDQKEVLFRKFCELKEKAEMDDEFYKLKSWLQQALMLPFDRLKTFDHLQLDNLTSVLQQIRSKLDHELYGMNKVKEQLLMFIHGKMLTPDMKGCCLGLVGPPGVGKCMDPNTLVLKHNGRPCKIRDLKRGDRLLSDDGCSSVEITSMCHGREEMFEICSNHGMKYRINKSHILTLYDTTTKTLVDVPLASILEDRSILEHKEGVRTSIDCFPEKEVPFEPRQAGYVFGILSSNNNNKAVSDQRPIFSFMKKYTSRRCIPPVYRYNSLKTRLLFLHGYQEYRKEFTKVSPPHYVDKQIELLHHTVASFLTVDHKYHHYDENRILLRCPIKEIISLGIGDYVGFTLHNKSNGRFLLKDGTITHNTSIARCLANVLDFPFEQISFGGIHQTEFIKGHDYTYVGSRPGEIAKCLMRMKYKNGILFLDEYEKISTNTELVSSLLHITDFAQNHSFRDNFFSELTLDLSRIWFVYSMNELPEDKALRDRIYSIQVSGYNDSEKVRILCDYLLPKHLANLHRESEDVRFISDDVAYRLIHRLMKSDEKGIRILENAVKNILQKISFLVTNQNIIKVSFLPPERFFPFHYPVQITDDLMEVLLKDFDTTPDNYTSMFL